ncbi:MAG: Ig-like domain-containing protein, partial [Dokdonella sp.]
GQYARGLAGLIDGPHTLSVRARDTWGNQAQTAPMPIIVDATPPLIVITGVADGDALNHAVAPQIAISDAHLASSDIRLNGVPFVSGTSVDSDENYVLSVRATDDAGNQSQRSVRFVINRVSPSVAITAPADGAVLAQSAIRVDVHSEAAAHVVLVTGVYQASAIADGAGNAGFDAVPLVDGLNRIEASASDRAGNIGGPVAINVTYQTVVNAPLTGTLQPDATDLAQGAALGVHLTVHNSNTSMVSSQQLRVQVLDASMSPLAEQLLTRDFTPQETFATDYSFASGSWPLGGLALALDLQQGGGWTRLDTKQITVVDLTPPLLALVAPSETDVLQGPITLHATASDGLTGIATVEASVDGGNWDALVAGVGDVYQSAEMALTDGDHQVDLRTHDGAGNSTSIGPVHFAVDNTPPLINIAGVAEGDLLSHAVSPVITVADAHLFTSDVRLNDVPFVSGTLINASGDYRIDVIASDVAGNRASSTLRFTLDLDPPTVVFTAPLPDAVVTVDTVEVIGQTEALAQVHLATGSFTVDVAADASGRFDVPGVPLQAGTNVLAARATDRAGNIGPDASVTVTYEVVQEAAVTGQIGVLTTPLKQGLPIDAPYAIQNTGGVALSALPLRFEMHALAGGDALVTEEFSLDLALGSHVDGIRHLATSTLVPGDYVLSLLADLPASGGPAAWVVLDTAAIALVGNPCYFNDVIFADGFDDANPHRGDFIFCNGFELNVATQSAVGIGYAPWIDATAWIATAVSPKDAAAKAVAFAWVHSRHTDNAQVDALTLHSSIGNPFASQRNRFAWPHEPAPDVLLAYAPVLPRRDWSRTSLMVERSGLQGIHLLADIADGRNLRLGQSEELR